MDCVTDAAATRSLHTQTCNFLCYISLSCYIHPPRDGCYRLPDERVVWTAWRLRDWWCCLTRAIWFCTAWLMLLPHQACTLSPENGFCLIRCWCMNCVTTAWLMLLCLLPVLHSDCVTDAAVTCTEAPEWGGVDLQVRIPDCVTVDDVSLSLLQQAAWLSWIVWTALLVVLLHELGLSEQSAWQLRDWCCGHTRPAHPVLYNVPGFCRQSRRDDCVNAAAGWLIVYC